MRFTIFCLLIITSGCSFNFERSAQEKEHAQLLIDQATLHLKQQNLLEAEATFELSNEVLPSAAALDGLGCVAFLRNDFEEAEKFFIRAYYFEENYYNSLANLALMYDLLGYEDNAKRLYQLSVKSDPTNYKIRNNYAALLYDHYNRVFLAEEELLKSKNLNLSQVVEKNLKRIKNDI